MRFVLLALLFLLLPFTVMAGEVTLAAQGDDLIITLPNEVPAKMLQLENPPRIAIDFPGTIRPDLTLPNPLPDGVKNIRSGQFDAHTVRVVIDLKNNVSLAYSQHKNTLTLTLNKRATGFAVKSKPTASKPVKEKAEAVPVKKPMIIIDAGHGGQDPGAIGEGGTREKDVVLKYALQLADALEESGKYEVSLTRKSDVFIPLRERVAIARKAKGAVFISLHADSAGDAVRGLSVYTLSETASDKEAEALAARENRSDIIAGLNLDTHDEDVANILISLAQRETNTHSASLADALVVGMQKHNIRLLDNTHRFAGFAVLKAPDIPSVLVETGFLSHPEEEKKLNDPSHRKRIVDGIEAGLDTYFDRLKRLEKKLP